MFNWCLQDGGGGTDVIWFYPVQEGALMVRAWGTGMEKPGGGAAC